MTLMNTYGERTTTLTKGEGPYLWDNQGRRYLDALSGIAVCGLGHAHPAVADAISTQAQTLVHASNLFNLQPQVELGKLLCDISAMDNVFFGNSGAEANEAAIKIARKYGNDKGLKDPQVIVTNNSFHGRTMATLSATGNPKVKAGFSPLVSGFVHVDYDDIEAVANAATENTVAVMIEPVQGEGGINIPNPDYLPALRALCDDKGWLLILDEIQSGAGRSGKFFAYQHYDFLPDVVTSAKGLGNGVPIGACLARGVAAKVLQAGNHGSTFGGNPLCCSAAITTIKTIVDGGYLDRATELGQRIAEGLRAQLAECTHLIEVRNQGLLIGIELSQDCGHLVELGKQAGIIFNVTAGCVVRLLPPLILTNAQADEVITLVTQTIKKGLE